MEDLTIERIRKFVETRISELERDLAQAETVAHNYREELKLIEERILQMRGARTISLQVKEILDEGENKIKTNG